MICRSSGPDGAGRVSAPFGSGTTTTSGCWPLRFATAAATWTAAVDSAREGLSGTAMVTLRSTCGRNSATVLGGISVPAKTMLPLTNRIGNIGSQQYPSMGTAFTETSKLVHPPKTSAPASGISISGRSSGGSGSRLMVRPFWLTVTIPDRRLTGISRKVFSATGLRPFGTGNVRLVFATSRFTTNDNVPPAPMSANGSVGASMTAPPAAVGPGGSGCSGGSAAALGAEQTSTAMTAATAPYRRMITPVFHRCGSARPQTLCCPNVSLPRI